MENLDPKHKKLLEYASKAEIDKLLPFFDVLEEIRDSLKVIAEKETPEKHKVELLGAELVTIKGEKGDKGDEPDDERLKELITPLIPEPIPGVDGQDGKNGEDGKDGRDGTDGVNGLDGKDGVNGENGKDGSPDTPRQIVEKLESLEEDERLDISAIKGIKELETSIRNSIPRSGGGSRRVFQPYRDDFSALTDGVTKTFYLSRAPLQTETVMCFGTDFPTILRPLIDFTITNKTLTLTSAIPAPSQGATLLVTYFS